ncbi:hypothetical protein PMAYCL1PPCAC_01585, partial [Pristionchus mayeri]
LRVSLNGLEDPIVEQLSNLLSSSINFTRIYSVAEQYNFTPADYMLCSHLLRNSTMIRLVLNVKILDDITAPSIMSIVSHTKDIRIECDETRLSDPAAFITQLAFDVSNSTLFHSSCSRSSFFGLPHSFWKKFLYEKLSNGSFESIEAGNMSGKITKAPIDLPVTEMMFLKWHKKV